MSPVTHLLVGWLVAEIPARSTPRDRLLVTLAGVVPDLDGLGAAVELATRDSDTPLLWFSEYHHLLHNGAFAAFCALAAFLLADHRLRSAALALLAFHVHLLCDLVGARGPDGYSWPIPYLQPFSGRCRLEWGSQWGLNAWPNFLITVAALALVFYLARRRGYSLLSLFSTRADEALVGAIRHRFPATARAKG